MPKKKWIDKKTSTTYHLVHRAQNDPLIHDPEAPSMVFTEVQAPNLKNQDVSTPSITTIATKIKTLTDLENELGDSTKQRRENEGEAAIYGIYYDDTEYDYMQHLREMGSSSDAVIVEAPKPKEKKPKDKLEDALASASSASTKIQLPEELLPSRETIIRTYQDQQDVPDALRGFQPDMDLRLREVLEALEDEAYVDVDEGIFETLTKSGEASQYEFEEQDLFDEEGEGEEGWESDVTETAIPAKIDSAVITQGLSSSTSPNKHQEEEPNEDWLREYSKFKKAQKGIPSKQTPQDDISSEIAYSVGNLSLSSFGTSTSYISSNKKRRQRRRKNGTLTATTGYSMSSSSLSRTEALTLLDDRFDRIEKLYSLDEENEEDSDDAGDVRSVLSVSTVHTAAASTRKESDNLNSLPETRMDFDTLMDEFLDNYTLGNRGRVKNMKSLTPMAQLDEIRRELGKPKKQVAGRKVGTVSGGGNGGRGGRK